MLLIEHLEKSFPLSEGGRRPVVRVDRFALAPGEQAALAGESGTGKTTLLHLVAGILTPDRGRVLLAGTVIHELPESARDRFRALHIGYVFQNFNLLQGHSALENVALSMMFGRGYDRERAASLLARVGLADRLHDRPRQLSSGQQQRVALARALANRPNLVLADEPTAHLDAANARTSMALLRAVCAENGAALLVVTHDDEAMTDFPRVERWGEINQTGATADLTRGTS